MGIGGTVEVADEDFGEMGDEYSISTLSSTYNLFPGVSPGAFILGHNLPPPRTFYTVILSSMEYVISSQEFLYYIGASVLGPHRIFLHCSRYIISVSALGVSVFGSSLLFYCLKNFTKLAI